MKLANRMAGMYWPKVPFAVTLKVRDEAKVARLARPVKAEPCVEVASWVGARNANVWARWRFPNNSVSRAELR